MKSHWIFLLIFAWLPGLTAAQEGPFMITRESAPAAEQVRLTEIASGLRRPLYVTHAGDGSNRLFVVEKVGKIWIIEEGEQQAEPFLDVSSLVTATAQGSGTQGLLGLAFHPDYQTRGQFYINYTDHAGDTVVSRYQVSSGSPNLADASSAQIIFRHAQPARVHNGGHMAFGPDGYLYISLGDGQVPGDPLGFGQNTLVLLGSILRIDVDEAGGGGCLMRFRPTIPSSAMRAGLTRSGRMVCGMYGVSASTVTAAICIWLMSEIISGKR